MKMRSHKKHTSETVLTGCEHQYISLPNVQVPNALLFTSKLQRLHGSSSVSNGSRNVVASDFKLFNSLWNICKINKTLVRCIPDVLSSNMHNAFTALQLPPSQVT
ncbi:hypothetical protein XU18_3844 [Perkinsela sp. CCAP 1560/4]|nr:hypothetical protein XU18_3844 [Perkinsela sp. CCAP 1560/4]|eukprot:KNH05029.1 hypothetical protein XU18_3844 [Perkinsela sp. CCAP 1560/4]